MRKLTANSMDLVRRKKPSSLSSVHLFFSVGLGITLPGTFSFGANGIGRNVLSMALCGAVSFSLVLAIEFKFFKSKYWSGQH